MIRRSRSLRAVAASAALATSCMLASCTATDAAPTTDPDLLRVAVAGAPSDTLDLTRATTSMPFAVGFNVFDSVVVQEGGSVSLQAVDSAEPDEAGTRWRLHVRPGTTFHDGAAVTAADVLYSLRYLGSSATYGSLYSDVDLDASTTEGDDVVVLVLRRPRADLIESALAQVSVVFPEGTTDFTRPLGSGPYRVESYSADSGAVLTANTEYWQGEPDVGRIEIVPIADAATRLSALTDGRVDLAVGLSATGAETLEGGRFQVESGGLQSSSSYMFTLNTALAPFDDPAVRTAFKQVVDRRQLVDVVFRGRGEIAADVVGAGLTGYDSTLEPIAHDPRAAAAVFAEHGITELGIVVAETAPGLTDSVTLLEQQLAAAGVELEITEADPSTLFSDLGIVRGSQIFASYLISRPVANTLPAFTSADATYNFSGWKDAAYNELLTRSQAELDPDERKRLLDAAQQRLSADGGDVVWGVRPDVYGAIPGLDGVEMSQSVPVLHDATIRG